MQPRGTIPLGLTVLYPLAGARRRRKVYIMSITLADTHRALPEGL